MAASFTRARRADELAENVADALARALAASLVARFKADAMGVSSGGFDQPHPRRFVLLRGSGTRRSDAAERDQQHDAECRHVKSRRTQ
jgi:hypothetical protein